MPSLWIVLGLIAVLMSLVVVMYNSLVSARQLVDNGWSDIEVQLKRRSDLIPQIIRTVKAYASHERELFELVIERRSEALKAGSDPAQRGSAETAMAKPVARLVALAEDYPALKANENFLDLQDELSETENKIELARRFYNGAVRQLNTKVRTFPILLIAGPFGFTQREYFRIDAADAEQPLVDFKA